MQLSLLDFSQPHFESYDIRQCFIEAAHYVMALNFQNEFEILHIDLQHKTGLKLIRDSERVLYPETYDHLALITFSGIAAATIYKHGREVLSEKTYDLPKNAVILDTEGLGAQYQLFKKYLMPVERFYLSRKLQTEWNTIITCFEFLINEPVWHAVEFVATFLSLTQGKEPSHLEITNKLCSQDFYPDLLASLNFFKMKRYPLTKENLNSVL